MEFHLLQKRKHYHPDKQRGFTLLEVLVALAILAVSSASLMISDGQSIRQVSRVQDKVIASWLAENTLNNFYIGKKWPEPGTSGNVQLWNERRWYVNTETSSTKSDKLRKIDVHIYTGDSVQPQNKVYALTGFIRRHRE